MNANVKYFGMIAEKITCTDEVLAIGGDDPIDLRVIFEGKYPELKEMSYKIAVNQSITDYVEQTVDNVEIALLPPFAGG